MASVAFIHQRPIWINDMIKFLRPTAFALLAAFAAHIYAQAANNAAIAYPAKSVRWVVHGTPGASTDIIARLIAAKLGDAWGQQFLVDARPGAGGLIGGDIVAKAAPDGYTLLLSNSGPSVASVKLSRKAPYRVDDFAPVILIGYTPQIIVANLAFAPKNPRELSEYLKANPGKVNWASSGVNSGTHVGLALFLSATSITATHVPYKGAAPALVDLMSGQTHVLQTTEASAEALIRAGRVKVIGVAADKRSSTLPDVPTLVESGIKDAEALIWFGISVPAKTPRDIVAKLNAETNRILLLPDISRRLNDLGLEVVGGSAEDFGKFIGREVEQLDKLIKSGALTPE